MKEKFVRKDLLEVLAAAGMESHKARKLIDLIIEAMSAALAAGRVIELRGLGTLEPRERKPRTRLNLRNMTPVNVPARKVIFFRASGSLKKALNGERPPEGTEKGLNALTFGQ
jgi:integration host factor subunit beta